MTFGREVPKPTLLRLGDTVSFELYELEDWRHIEWLARQRNQAVYTYKTTCRANWLERGLSAADTFGLVLMPLDTPETVGLPYDAAENDH